jgi:hypothetical protein
VKYTQPSFSVPPADLHNGTNRHGQTWDDIFSVLPIARNNALCALGGCEH